MRGFWGKWRLLLGLDASSDPTVCSVTLQNQSALNRPEIDTLVSYWDSLPRAESLPRRIDFDPMAVPSILKYVVLVERHEQQYFVQLAGDSVQWDGVSLRGATLSVENFGELATELVAMYDRVVETRKPVFFHGKGSLGRKEGHSFSQVILPLLDDAGELSNFVALVAYDVRT